MLQGLRNFISSSVNYISRFANYWLGFKNTQLLGAAFAGNTALVSDLLSRGAFIDCKDNKGNTPLHLAALNGCMQTVEKLLANKANIKTVNHHKETALHMAASAGNTATVLFLLKNGALLIELNKDGDSPLHVAVNKGKLDTLISLLDSYPIVESAQFNSLLKNAAANEKLAIISWLMDHHPQKNNIDAYELLKTCVQARALEALRYLMGCFRHVPRSELNNLVNLAVSNVDLQSVKALISLGGNINNPKKPILTTIKNGQLDLFKGLVSLGADIFVTDNEGNNALHLAAQGVNYNMLKDILSRKMLDPKDTNNDGLTPKDIIEDKIIKLLEKLNQNKQDNTLRLEMHSKTHRLLTLKYSRLKTFHHPEEFKRFQQEREIILTNEIAAMDKLAQKEEAVLTAKINKLNKIRHLLAAAEIHFQQSKIIHPVAKVTHFSSRVLPSPSAPPMDEAFLATHSGFAMPYYNTLNPNTNKLNVGTKKPHLTHHRDVNAPERAFHKLKI